MRYTIVLVFLLLFVVPFEVQAHTYLSSSVPEEGTVIETSLQDVTLSFKTDIDAISTMKIVTNNGDTVPFEKLNVMQRELKGRLTQPLENGTYTIEWKIVGEDGHPISGTVPFEVQLTEVTNNSESLEDESMDRQEKAASVQTDQTSSNSDSSVSNSSNLLITLLVSGLGVIAILSLGYLLRKRV